MLVVQAISRILFITPDSRVSTMWNRTTKTSKTVNTITNIQPHSLHRRLFLKKKNKIKRSHRETIKGSIELNPLHSILLSLKTLMRNTCRSHIEIPNQLPSVCSKSSHSDPKTDQIRRNPNPNQQIQTQSKQNRFSFINSLFYLLVLLRRPSARRIPGRISTRAAQVDPPQLMPPLHRHHHPFFSTLEKRINRRKRSDNNN